MIASICNGIAKSRRARHYLRRLSNSPAYDPIFNIMAERVSVGLRRIAGMGMVPDIVIDVGANEGRWTTEQLPIFPNSKFVMIEAQSELAPALDRVVASSGGRVKMVIAMLGPRENELASFFLSGTGSSRFPEMTSFARRKVSMPMTTLDAVVGDLGSANVFLKMDVQGGEIDILEGAASCLRNVQIVLMEASIVQYNHGAPRLAEIIRVMDGLGFRLFDIWDLRRIGPVLGQCDVVFVRKGGELERFSQKVVAEYGRT